MVGGSTEGGQAQVIDGDLISPALVTGHCPLLLPGLRDPALRPTQTWHCHMSHLSPPLPPGSPSTQQGREWGERAILLCQPAGAPGSVCGECGRRTSLPAWEEVTLTKHLLCAQPKAWHTSDLHDNRVAGCHSPYFVDEEKAPRGPGSCLKAHSSGAGSLDQPWSV